MKCVSCSVDFNDGVQCSSCGGHLDFACANITEVGWRKLGNDRRAAWKCPRCRIASPARTPILSPIPTPEPASLETILSEIRELKMQLAGLPILSEDVKLMREELKDLKTSREFDGCRLDEFSAKLAGIESRVVKLENLEESLLSLQTDVDTIKSESAMSDQRSRLNNVEIKGIPQRKDENLFTILDRISQRVNFPVLQNQINFITRIPVFGGKDKPIIVSFLNRYIKEDFIAAARLLKGLSGSDLGFVGVTNRVYINDHLNSNSKKLLNRTRLMAKEKEYRHVWVKHAKIHVRKHDGSAVLIIASDGDLNRLK
ncbi:uncharacterized protein LOC111359637 [Spodoptera litura]|uniref:Uncharacterized protein LOC111359637 n=1 Tax=Spodoptera litura TaxID=69820 RepID=A0A9J7EH98_SPOLT|nr:uncharacterized protein LOC111359637 [Spodoptera litura]